MAAGLAVQSTQPFARFDDVSNVGRIVVLNISSSSSSFFLSFCFLFQFITQSFSLQELYRFFLWFYLYFFSKNQHPSIPQKKKEKTKNKKEKHSHSIRPFVRLCLYVFLECQGYIVYYESCAWAPSFRALSLSALIQNWPYVSLVVVIQSRPSITWNLSWLLPFSL